VYEFRFQKESFSLFLCTFAVDFEITRKLMNNIDDMTVGNPTHGITHFALPLILGYILQQMYLVIDAAIVGQWIGVRALAAVGASSSVMFLIIGFCNGSAAGFAIPVAQAFGAKEYAKMRAYVANAVRIAAVIAVVITLFTVLFCHYILKMVNTPQDIFHDAYVFLLLQFLAIPFTILYNLLSGLIRALGNSIQPFYFLLAASGLNILLDALLIMLLGMGVEGAGIATLLSQAFAGVLCVFYIRRHMQLLLPHGREREYHDHMVGHLLNNGIPMGLQFSITAIGIILLQSANNALGTTYVAAFTASMRVKYLFTCVFENIGVAMATYCGQNFGAGKMERIKKGIGSALKIMIIYVIFTLLIIGPFANDMMLLFVKSGEQVIIDNAAMYMRISNYFYPALGLLCILRYSIQGLGYSNLSMLSGVMEMIARCGVSLWLVPAFHFIGVCYGDPVAWIAADIFLVPAMIMLYKKLRHKQLCRAACMPH